MTTSAGSKSADLALKLGTEGGTVGPGTYSKDLKWGADATTCPFQSSSQRPPPNRWKTKFVTPSPATYELRKPADEAPPHRPRTGPAGMGYKVSNSSFRATGKRVAPWLTPGSNFVESTVRDNPGPGEYNVSLSSKSGQDIADVVHPKLECRGSAPPVLGTSMSAPAIPVLRDGNGVKYTGRAGNSLGPGDYEVDSMERPCHVIRKTAPTVNFHSSESERSLYPPACSIDFSFPSPANPGAGTYNVRLRMRRGTDQPFKSRTPKIAEVVHNDTPGPGTYPEGDGLALSGNEDKEKLFPGMSSASSRSRPEWWRPCDKTPLADPEYLKVPGPGHYPQPASSFVHEPTRRSRSTSDVMGRRFHAVHTPHIMLSLKDTDGSQVCGFLSTETKFADKPIVVEGVSPGQYNHTDVSGQSLMANVREREPIGRKGVFGTCNDRWHGSAFDPTSTAPGPGTYEHGLVTADKRFTGPTQPGMSSFKCNVQQRPEVQVGPAGQSPGQYEAFDGVDYFSKFRKAATEHISFGMGHSRWEAHDVADGKTREGMPGPGIYDPKKPDTYRGGVARTSQRRLHKPHIDCDTGPGQYNVRTSMIKKTFNVAGKLHARKAHGELIFDLPQAGGGAGGGVAGTRARLKPQRRLRRPELSSVAPPVVESEAAATSAAPSVERASEMTTPMAATSLAAAPASAAHRADATLSDIAGRAAWSFSGIESPAAVPTSS